MKQHKISWLVYIATKAMKVVEDIVRYKDPCFYSVEENCISLAFGLEYLLEKVKEIESDRAIKRRSKS